MCVCGYNKRGVILKLKGLKQNTFNISFSFDLFHPLCFPA